MKRIFFLLLTISFSLTLHAETLYVGDTLRVGVRAEPSDNTPSITVIDTGTRLDIMERRGSHVKVRTPSGVEGWVKGAYLSNIKPAKVLLRDTSQRVEQLEKELAQLRKMQPGQAIQNEALAQTIDRLEQEKAKLLAQLESGEGAGHHGNMDSNTAMDLDFMHVGPSIWVGVLTIFFISLGFLFGVSWHKSQVTKRLGGLTL